MRHLLLSLCTCVLFAESRITITAEALLQKLAPANVDLNAYADARAELNFHIKECGLGVVDSEWTRGMENRCTHQIKLDEVFFTARSHKTGYTYRPDWPYEAGAEFMDATPEELRNVPATFDIADYGPMIRIFKQQCGDCWAQATRANLEQLIATFDKVLVPLSTQTLISSCCNHGSCQGGYMTTADWVVKYGLPLEERDPYLGTNSSCKFNMATVQMDYKLLKSPYAGNSLNYSRYYSAENRPGTQVASIQALMMRYRSSAIVTIAAISQSGGIITNCSAINSGGDHMQDVVGWYPNPADPNDVIARVQNSWGTSHGTNGYTHMKWECGSGKHNRGLGVAARVGVYAMKDCGALPEAYTGPAQKFERGSAGVVIGKKTPQGQTCEWFPATGLTFSSLDKCEAIARPNIPTEYHVKATTRCASSTAMVLVTPTDQRGKTVGGNRLLTPHGETDWVAN